MCAETIKARARICPRCQSRQSRYTIWAYEVAVIAASLLMATSGICFIAWFAPDDKGTPGIYRFAGHRNELVATDTSMLQIKGKSAYRLTGVVTNRGSMPWRVHEFEIRILDNNGDLLDVIHKKVEQPFVVQPRNDQAFRLDIYSSWMTNEATLHQVRVQDATDGNRPWNPD
jgi:hypothetical protein